ncbi:MAG: ATP-dependent helicase HrpB [bacterium]|nr:ATP-dependent helicase HrpB [bacterium]
MSTLDLTSLQTALAANDLTVLTAPPGTGKTTRVPLALLEAPWLQGRKILVLEPRRLAARRAAQYMAALLGEAPGETIGWKVRSERCIGPKTRVEFLTEGLLARRLLEDPELATVGLIIFDEFHERSLALDVAFALAREIRANLRDDLRLLVMSATMDEHLLPEARFLSIPAVAYPVEISHLGPIAPATAILRALREEEGSILCFLPGEGEITALVATLREAHLPPNVRVAPLYAALDKAEQDAAVAPPAPGVRKIVLATSIAESSLTIEGIRVVIDSGLARVPKFAPRNGLTRLVTQRIPLDRATQRTGRAGRLSAGRCYRLWTEGEELTFTKISQPEILDADLTQVALMCAEWGSEFQWLTPPPPSAWKRAKETLINLKAMDTTGRLTPLGKEMVRFPVHPALAAMMLRMQTIDPAGGALLAAICSEGEKIASLRQLTDFRRVLEVVLETRPRELWRLAERWARRSLQPRLSVDELAPYLLWAFPGHLAKARDKVSGRYLLAAGFGAVLPQGSPFLHEPWLLAVRMSDGEGEARLRWVLPLQPENLALCPTTTRTRIEWDKPSARLIVAEETCIGAIVLKQRPLKEIPPEAQTMANRCRLEHEGLPWTKSEEHLAARLRFLHRALPEENWPALDEATLINALAEAPHMTLTQVLQAQLISTGHTLPELDREAPARFEVPSGSKCLIHYDQTHPYVAVKIQEVFGLKATPCLACGRVPMVLHLLSPAQRPVQVTSDLQSFWANGYTIVRKDMRGRYPKHYWPEDPTIAIASRKTTQKPTP